MTETFRLVDRLLDVMAKTIVPLTEQGVEAGNKVFGAALLRKDDLSLVLAATNNEMENPLWHGEMHLLKCFYELPTDQRPQPENLIFLSTHEPCSLCLSAITWTGFDNFYYFFSYEDSRDAFAIPHDLLILQDVFHVKEGNYCAHNRFWQAHSINELISALPQSERSGLQKKSADLYKVYARLSDRYQSSKATNAIPLN